MSLLQIHQYVILMVKKGNYYGGYSIEELAQKSSFLKTAFLLIWGELPTASELRDFEQEVQMHRRLSFRVRDMMKCFPASGHPMDVYNLVLPLLAFLFKKSLRRSYFTTLL